ncbi:MAG: hypothetical protein ACI9S8_000856 [Chlamydiales bacterium]|jgi:hypothetical protein
MPCAIGSFPEEKVSNQGYLQVKGEPEVEAFQQCKKRKFPAEIAGRTVSVITSNQEKAVREIDDYLEEQFEGKDKIYLSKTVNELIQGIAITSTEDSGDTHIQWIATAPWNIRNFSSIPNLPQSLSNPEEGGVGTELISEIARDNPGQQLHVNSSDQAIVFYEKMGFAKVIDPSGEMPNYMALAIPECPGHI